jgi:hypothetical protein
LLNQFMASKNKTKNRLKTRNQPETKKLYEFRYVFLGVFKAKKHLILTPSSYGTF